MHILLVNPNTTASMTEKMGRTAEALAAPGTQVTAVNPTDGPASIEGPYDEALCLPGLLKTVKQGVADGADAVIVACFDDTGIDACRALVPVPVIGICHAAMQVAVQIADSFSIVTTLPRSVPVLEGLALSYGMERRCRRVRAADVPVLALEEPGGVAADLVRAEVAAAVRQDGAEAVLLGCAGMTDLAAALSKEFGIPVIDGVAAAVKLAEALVGLGAKTSKVGLYASPRAKRYDGLLADFAPTAQDQLT